MDDLTRTTMQYYSSARAMMAGRSRWLGDDVELPGDVEEGLNALAGREDPRADAMQDLILEEIARHITKPPPYGQVVRNATRVAVVHGGS